MLKYAIILLIFFSACSAGKRCQRHISKAKELGCLAVDSFVVHDTVRGFRIDTIVRFDTLSYTDTLTLEKDGVKSTTIIKWKERLVSQEITKQDTIYKFKFKTLKEIKTVEKNKWWVWPALLLSWAAIFGLIFKKWGG